MFLNFCAQTFKWFISFCYWRETFGDVVRSPQLAHFYRRPWGREVWVPPEMGIGGWAAHTKLSLSLSQIILQIEILDFTSAEILAHAGLDWRNGFYIQQKTKYSII